MFNIRNTYMYEVSAILNAIRRIQKLIIHTKKFPQIAVINSETKTIDSPQKIAIL